MMTTQQYQLYYYYGQQECIKKLTHVYNKQRKRMVAVGPQQHQLRPKQHKHKQQPLILLVGPPGNGKTTLATSLTKQVIHKDKGYFVSARIHPIDLPRPLQPLIEICRRLIEEIVIRTSNKKDVKKFMKALQSSLDVKEVKVLVNNNVFGPALQALFPTVVVSSTGSSISEEDVKEEADTNRENRSIYNHYGNLTTSIVQMLRAICKMEKPVAVFLDDLHLVDPTSSSILHVLKMIMLDPKIDQLFVMVAFRPIDILHPTSQWLQTLEKTGTIDFVPIQPKPITDIEVVTEWMKSVVKKKSLYDPNFSAASASMMEIINMESSLEEPVRTIVQLTNGNACAIRLYIELLVMLLLKNGQKSTKTATTLTTITNQIQTMLKKNYYDEAGGGQGTETNLRHLFQILFNQLPSKSQKICQIASCMGPIIDIDRIKQIIGDDDHIPTTTTSSFYDKFIGDNTDLDISFEDCVSDYQDVSLTIQDALKEAQRNGILQFVVTASTSTVNVDESTNTNSSDSNTGDNANDTDGGDHAIKEGYYQFSNFIYRDLIYTETMPSDKRILYHAAIGNICRRDINDNYNGSISGGGGVHGVIEHCSTGRSLLSPKQLQTIANLCVLAGNISLYQWYEYQSASKYFNLGIDFLLQSSNITNKSGDEELVYGLTLKLYKGSAEVSYRSGNYGGMHKRIEQINLLVDSNKKRATSLDKVAAQAIQIKALVSQTRHQEAIRLGLELLQTNLEEYDIANHSCETELKTTRELLEDESDSAILSCSPMLDPTKLAAMEIMNTLLVSALVVGGEGGTGGEEGHNKSSPSVACSSLLITLACRIVKATLQYGITGASVVGLSMLGAIICIVDDDIDDGIRCTNVGLKLSEILDEKHNENDGRGSCQSFCSYKGRAMTIYWGFMTRYVQPFLESQDPLKVAYRLCMEIGDWDFAVVAPVLSVFNMLVAGGPLSSTSEALKSLYQMLLKKNQNTLMLIVRPFLQMTSNLLGVSGETDPTLLPVSVMMGQDDYEYVTKSNNSYIEYSILLCQSMLAFYMHKYENARALMDKCNEVANPGILVSTLDVQVYFFDAMSSIGMASICGRKLNTDTNIDKKEHKQFSDNKVSLISNAERCLGKLRIFARHAPDNVRQRVLIIQAELHAINGNIDEAEALFQKAMEHAEQHDQLSDRALACERAGLALRACGKEDHALDYLEDCCAMYRRWGSLIKVNHIKGNVIPGAIYDWDK